MKFKGLKKITIALLLLVLSSGAFVLFFKENRDSAKVVNMMTAEERYYLDAFLHRILFSDSFAYVLFGSKPIAFESYENSTRLNMRFDDLSISNLNIRRGFEVFKKYRYLFSSPNITVHFYDYPEGSGLIMINRANVLHVFEQHKSDFKQILGSDVTGENLLAQIAANDEDADNMNHEALWGILLGYGRNNAWLFHHRTTILRELDEMDSPFKTKDVLEKEYNKINRQLKSFNIYSSDRKSFLKKSYIGLPGFMADPNSSETKELKKQYAQDREKIMKIFDKRSVVEVTLEQLMNK